MCLAFDASIARRRRARSSSDVLEMQPPQGLVEKVRGLQKLKSIADSLPKTVRARARARRSCSTGDDVDPRPAADPALLARRRGAVHHAARGDHARPAHGTRNVGMYRMQKLDRARDVHALADPQGRPRRTTSPPTAGIEVAVALGLDPVTAYSRERAAAQAHRRVHARRLPRAASRSSSCRAKTVDLEVPANAEIVLEGYVEQGRARATRGRSATTPATTRRPSRSPSSTLTAMTMRARRDLSVDRRRQAAAGGRVARQGDRADLPAGDPDDRAGDRRLRPAGRRRVPQLLHRLDPQGVPRPRAEGHARDLGPRDAEPDEVRSSSSTSGSTCTTTSEVFFRVGANVDPKRDVAAHRGAARPPRPRADAPVLGGKIGIDATAQGPGRGRARVAAGDRDERRDRGARRPRAGRSTGSRSTRCRERPNPS